MNSQIHDEDQTPEATAEVQDENPTEGGETQAAAAGEQVTPVTQEMYAAAQTQAQEYLEGWQRARAEFANYKKRVEREMKDSHSSAAGSVLKDVLPVIDDFERAMSSVPEPLQGDPWVGGVGMILRKLHKVLEDYNVTVIDPTGEPFDPNRHEAIGMDDSSDVETGHVTVTVQKGYVLGDRVLRPALVRVAN
ncbi:MAG: nucleotide exchange factor GrpE [Anaerolineae bacterium]|nr:nucleotide exchange factor GrpE [Anaerolineae bacterium]